VILSPDNRTYRIVSKYKGDLQMKMSLRFTAGAVLALITGAVSFAQHYTQTNLVSNTSGVAPVTDPQLVNPWGLSRSSSSPWWISENATGLSTLYNGAGAKQSLVVTIPQADPNNKNTATGTPTGTIANSSQTDFLLAPGKPSLFLFATIVGTIAGWNPTVAVAQGAAPPSANAVTVVKTADGSAYTGGIAISEAVEVSAKDPSTKYALGSVLNHVLLHQTVIGLEAMEQMALAYVV
jgi:hypothetical protein